MNNRPTFINHYLNMPSRRDSYLGDDELMSIGTPLSRPLGLTRLGIHHESLPPGSRTSWPHAEELEEEFFYVLEGTPDVWIDGELFRLKAGDAMAFVPGTGIGHTVINNTEEHVRILVVGENFAKSKITYLKHPEGYAGMPVDKIWVDAPVHDLGSHDGLPEALRVLGNKS